MPQPKGKINKKISSVSKKQKKNSFNLTVNQKILITLGLLSLLAVFLVRKAYIEFTEQSRIGMAFWISFLILLSIILLISYLVVDSQIDRLQEYEYAKETLSKNPTDIQLRKAALEAGRKYYASLRGGYTTDADERAIANDLSIYMNLENQQLGRNKTEK
ncbi:hypothetical protein [Limnoraphis robusta]|uniref:Uncharacterized protein n=1 Tax=Limnoraphis robusta CCNP1315 TaxID=3110306 RepID=A0ABU5TWL4_9CYAN|nr:hypothetical protein [Limnoraphis robusta]MEA5518928.1 hypothetical protein [Limnoraphis robusta CCNP1315]MEA5548434.1 hypothetical protein [Limnoraphis robusta CCNP1324]